MNFRFNSLIFSTIICLNNFVDCRVEQTDITDLIDLTCKTNSDCSEFVKTYHNTTCIDEKCTCYNQNSEEIKCSPGEAFYNNIIGGSCPCLQPHSECNLKSEICYCRKDYTATMDKRRCIKKKLQLGETCEDDAQCIYQEKFSECDVKEKICKCQKNFVEFNKGCASIVNLDEHCETDKQCSNKTLDSICVLKKCVCDNGTIANSEKTKCLAGVGYEGECFENNQCKLKLGVGSECYSGRCSCDIKHQLLKTKSRKRDETHYTCEKDVVFGDYCREHNDCYRYKEEAGQQSMQCYHGECACRPDFLHRNNTCVLNGAQAMRTNMISTILIAAAIFIVLSTLWRNSFPNL